MPKLRSPSMGFEASAEEAAGKSRNGSSSSDNVLSMMLSSLRGSPGEGVGTASMTMDTNWAQTYKITHHTDRPRRDKRETLRRRDSVDVLGKLQKIWQKSERMVESKRSERVARQREKAVSVDETSLRIGKDSMHSQKSGSKNQVGNKSQIPNLRTDLVTPSFGSRPPLPIFARSEIWRKDGGLEQVERRGFRETFLSDTGKKIMDSQSLLISSSSISSPISPDRVTIQVGLDLDSPRYKEKFSVRNYRSFDRRDAPLPPTPLSLTASPTSPRPASWQLPSLAEGGGDVRKQQVRSPSHNPPPSPPPRSRARLGLPMAERENTTVPPMLLEPVAYPGSIPPRQQQQQASAEFTSSRVVSDPQPIPKADSRLETLPGTVYRTADSDSKKKRSTPSDSVGGARTTELSPSLVRKKSVSSKVASRFNRDRAGFGLGLNRRPTMRRGAGREKQAQELGVAYPPMRHHLGRAPSGRVARQRSVKYTLRAGAGAAAVEDHDRNGLSHISFQLAGWRTSPSTSPSPPSSPAGPVPEVFLSHRVLDSSQNQGQAPTLSGPLLEPKTFRPAPKTFTKQVKSSNYSNSGVGRGGSVVRRRPSVSSRRRAKGGVSVAGSNLSRKNSEHHRNNPPIRLNVKPDVDPNSDPNRCRSGQEYRGLETFVKHSPFTHSTFTPPLTALPLPSPTALITPSATAAVVAAVATSKVIKDTDIYGAIESVIDCYLWLAEAPESENERRKIEAMESYSGAGPLDIAIDLRNFF